MSDDSQDKTEEPTPKKLADARKKGIVAKSQDLTVGIMLLCSMGILFFFAGFMFQQLSSMTIIIFNNLNYKFDDIEFVSYITRRGVFELLWLVFPLFAGIIFLALLGNILQVGFLFSSYSLIPKWRKINPLDTRNYENLFSLHALVKLVFGLFRINIVTIFSWVIIALDMYKIYDLTRANTQDVLIFIYKKAIVVGSAISIGYLFVALLDLMYQKWKFNKDMKMSRRELKDEIKQMQGDEKVKSKIRLMMQTLTQSEMQKIVAFADVVITSGDKLAVALRYREENMRAPICIAKGVDRKALTIKIAAKKHNVFIVDNPRLAQSLYRAVQIDGYVPPVFYYPVADAMVANLGNAR